MRTTRLHSLFTPYLLAVSLFLGTSEGVSLPNGDFKMSVHHGHIYVTWTVDKDFRKSNAPINYTVNYCPGQINHGMDACDNVTAICRATYVHSANISTGFIRGYANNIERYLKKRNFEEINDTIETKGSLVEVAWDREKQQFKCGIFLHRCMDGQFKPSFMYEVRYNGNTSLRYNERINFNSGPPVKAENLSIQQEPLIDGFFNVIVKWQIIHVCRVDVPDFTVWLTVHNETVSKVKMVNIGKKVYSFAYMFGDLLPSTQYTVHVESLKMTEDAYKTYVSKTFWTPAIENVRMNLKTTTDRGFVLFSWTVEKRFLNRSIPVVYNISWCVPKLNPKPYNCKNSIKLCSAVYKGPRASNITLYEKNLRKNKEHIGGSTSGQWINGMWDEVENRFHCGVYLNICQQRLYERLKFEINVNGLNLKPAYRKIMFTKGFSINPEHFTATSELQDGGTNVTLAVRWQLREQCARNAASRVSAEITRNNNSYGKKEFTEYDYDTLNKTSTTTYFNFKWPVKGLEPYTWYTVHIKTENETGTTRHFKRKILTPEGVPEVGPTLASISWSDCERNQRNVSIQWEMPPKVRRNGVIQNIDLVYWEKVLPENKTELALENVTSFTLVGLKCYVKYQVQVRACLRNRKCSPYSAVTDVGRVSYKVVSPKSDAGSIILWTVVGIAVTILILSFIACQCFHHRRRRKPLDMCEESNITKGYSRAYEVELSRPGIYNMLDENEEV